MASANGNWGRLLTLLFFRDEIMLVSPVSCSEYFAVQGD
jgi:hypothetical protein